MTAHAQHIFYGVYACGINYWHMPHPNDEYFRFFFNHPNGILEFISCAKEHGACQFKNFNIMGNGIPADSIDICDLLLILIEIRTYVTYFDHLSHEQENCEHHTYFYGQRQVKKNSKQEGSDQHRSITATTSCNGNKRGMFTHVVSHYDKYTSQAAHRDKCCPFAH